MLFWAPPRLYRNLQRCLLYHACKSFPLKGRNFIKVPFTMLCSNRDGGSILLQNPRKLSERAPLAHGLMPSGMMGNEVWGPDSLIQLRWWLLLNTHHGVSHSPNRLLELQGALSQDWRDSDDGELRKWFFEASTLSLKSGHICGCKEHSECRIIHQGPDTMDTDPVRKALVRQLCHEHCATIGETRQKLTCPKSHSWGVGSNGSLLWTTPSHTTVGSVALSQGQTPASLTEKHPLTQEGLRRKGLGMEKQLTSLFLLLFKTPCMPSRERRPH